MAGMQSLMQGAAKVKTQKNPILILALGLVPIVANAFCSSPTAPFDSLPPPPSAFSQPREPFCLSDYKYTGRHTCSSWELESYFNDVEQYAEELRRFADDAKAYANEVIDYANDAVDYANCEISSLNDRIR